MRNSIAGFLSLVLVLLLIDGLNAAPKVEWRRNFQQSRYDEADGASSRYFWSENVIATPDSGSLLIGQYRNGARESATAAVKIDRNGEIEWFADPMKPRGKTIKRGMNGFAHSNGDYILTGTYEMSGGYWVACLSPDGKVKWDTTHRLEGFSYSLIEGENGEIITANDTATGLRLRKYTPEGAIVWNKIYPVRNKPFEWNQNLRMADGELSMVCTYNGEPQICRFSSSLMTFGLSPLSFAPYNYENFSLVRPSNGDALFLDGEEGYDFVSDKQWSFAGVKRFDAKGKVVYDKHLMLGSKGDILMKGAFDLPDGSLVICGKANNGPEEYFISRLDEDGDTLMTAFYPTETNNEFLMKATRMVDGGVLFLGSSRMAGRTWLIKIAPSPELLPHERGLFQRVWPW